MKLLFFNIRLTYKRHAVYLNKFILSTIFRVVVVEKTGIYLLAFLCVSQAASAALWTDVAQTSTSSVVAAKLSPAFHQRLLNADPGLVAQKLQIASAAQAKSISGNSNTIKLPMPDGSMKSYRVVYSPIIANGQAANYPQFKSYKVYALDGSSMTGRVNTTPLGFNAFIDTPKGTVEIDVVPGSHAKQYRSYYRHDYALAYKDKMLPFHCSVEGRATTNTVLGTAVGTTVTAAKAVYVGVPENKIEGALKDYRIEVAATAEYSQAIAAKDNFSSLLTTDPVTARNKIEAEIYNDIDQINQIYERDLGIHLNLVMNTNIIYLDSSVSGDPFYSDYGNPGALLSDNQKLLDEQALIETTQNPPTFPYQYDVGQVFNTGGGGEAAIDSACDSTSKGEGETGLPNPYGKDFYIDYVAHELGHQFGADHTFNGTTGGCGPVNGVPNRNPATAYEPGSGSTIMAYAGNCYDPYNPGASEDIATTSDPVFHAGSVNQIRAYTTTGTGGTCYQLDTSLGVGNHAPVVNALSNYTIPAETDFELKGSATDADGDSLLYRWDEMDTGIATDATTIGTDLGNNPLFRSYPPTSSPDRTFPTLKDVLNNTVNVKGETLPTTTRTLHFRLTAEDGKGGSDTGDMQVSVDSRYGPFKVLQPNSSTLTLDSAQPQVIEWDPSCSTETPINCANVDILYSSDNGATFTPIVTGTPNDGSETVTLPAGTTSHARIEVRCSNNIFYAVSQQFSVSDVSGGALTSSGAAINQNCGLNKNYDVEPNNTIATASHIQVPITFSGTVNSASDSDDYYEFIPLVSESYTVTLSGYGTNSLNVYLLVANYNIVGDNVSSAADSKAFSEPLVAGQTYYIRVSAVNTASTITPYTLSVNPGIVSAAPAPSPSSNNSGGGSMGIVTLFFVILPLWLRSAEKPHFS